MAHFARLNELNIVMFVDVVSNSDIDNLPFPESEQVGINFLNSIYGETFNWKQTSYNGNFRKNYAGIGYSYDSVRDAFIPPKPYPSWILNESTCLWEAPVPIPTPNSYLYYWDEATLSWKLIE